MYGFNLNRMGVQNRGPAGSTPATPGNPGEGYTTLLWLDASDTGTITDTGGLVDQWDSLEGRSLSFTGSGATRPTTGVASQNSLNGIRFAGDYLTSTLVNTGFGEMHQAAEFNVFVVFNPGVVADPNASYGIMGDCAGSSSAKTGYSLIWSDLTSFSRNETIQHVIGAGLSSSPPNRAALDLVEANGSSPVQTPQQIAVEYDLDNATYADRSRFYPGGSLTGAGGNIHTATPSAVTGSSHSFQIGAVGNNVLPATMDIFEIIVVVGPNDTTFRQDIEAYLASKWGLTLPGGHPGA